MAKTIKIKRVSYGTVEIVDTESAWGTRYSLRINDRIKAQSDNLNFIVGEYDKLY